MEIQLNNSPIRSSNNQKQNVESRTNLTSDYEMFLQMLTTQMTNQDPLNPVDSSDYAVQLATFSSVEQQVLTNELLTDLTQRFGGAGLSDLGNWIGREVRSTAPVQFNGEPITLSAPTTGEAERFTLMVRGADNAVVEEIPIAKSPGLIQWAGVASDGTPLPQGRYTFSVASYEGEEMIGEEPASHYARVTEARIENDGTKLVLPGGVLVSPDDVTAVRS